VHGEALPLLQLKPAEQGPQLLADTSGCVALYVPGAQAVQVEAVVPAEDQLPSGHDVWLAGVAQ